MVGKFGGHPSRLRKPNLVNKMNLTSNFFKWRFRVPSFLKFGSRIPIAILIGALAGVFIAFIIILFTDFDKVRALAGFKPNITTKIYDKNGFLISELFRQKREVVELSKIPKTLIDAFIANEDREFYDHFGINIKGIVRAFFINIFSGRIKQGGSTITQQLAKILLTSRKRSIYRKVKDIFIAIMMEFFYTKDKILELYFNQIFLGHGVYGVESASRFYFQKHVWDLDLAESALLATLPSSPNRLSPIRHPKRSMERHKIVLASMVEVGFINIQQAEEAFLGFWPGYLEYINELSPTQNTFSIRMDRAPWFTEYIRRIVINKYGERTVYENGLMIYTTLDLNKQIAGQRILKESLNRQSVISNRLLFKNEDHTVEKYSDTIEIFSLLFNLKQYSKKGSYILKKLNDYLQKDIIDELEIINYLIGLNNIGAALHSYRSIHYDDKIFQNVEGSIISINHTNGYIETMIGGNEFSSINQLNRVMQSQRQPGSAIKPLLYAAAIESGKYTTASAILDSPIVYLDNEGSDWIPENYEGEYYGLVRLRSALAKSINGVSIRIADNLGIDYIMKYFSKLLKIKDKDVTKRIPRNFSIALGSFEVSPFELARAYAIIANGGKDVIPYCIRHIKDRNGDILENQEQEISRILKEKREKEEINIISSQTAQVVISMLCSVITYGTGRVAEIGMPAGGKTGTTNNWKDAWFVGFTPLLTTCVWTGYDGKGLSLGIGQSGGAVAAPIWAKYMGEVMKNNSFINFPQYAKLVETRVCARSGKLPSHNCSNIIDEVFIKDTIPEETCEVCKDIHYTVKIHKKGPKSNIARVQRKEILKNIKSANDEDSFLNNIGNDLLE